MSYAQNWKTTDLTPASTQGSDAFPITDLISHQGTLMATVNKAFSGTLELSNDNGKTWEEAAKKNVQGFPTFLASNGTTLFLISRNGFHSLLYSSSDKGATFSVEDITGLPSGFGGGFSLAESFQIINGRLVIGLGASGYYQKQIGGDSFIKFDTPTGLNSASDPLAFYDDTLYVYDNSGAFLLYKSGDFGQNWSVTSMNNLPSNYGGDILHINQSTGRLYLGLGKANVEYNLYFSDDNGENWSQYDFNDLVDTNYQGGPQVMSAIYTKGDLLFVAFENNSKNTTPDVFSTIDVHNIPISYDTLGLLSDGAGTVKGNIFLEHSGNLYLALNIVDVFYKEGVIASTSDISGVEDAYIYPSVITDRIHFHKNLTGEFTIVNNEGKIIKNGSLKNENKLMLSLAEGSYIFYFKNKKSSFSTMILKQ